MVVVVCMYVICTIYDISIFTWASKLLLVVLYDRYGSLNPTTNLIYTVYACHHVCKHLFMYEYIKNGCIYT